MSEFRANEQLTRSDLISSDEEAHNNLLSDYLDSAKSWVKEHPVTTGAMVLGIAGGLAFATRGRWMPRAAAEAVGDVIKGVSDDAVNGAAKMSATTERSVANGGLLRDVHGKEIPDLVRSAVPDISLEAGEAPFKRAMVTAELAYQRDLTQLWSLPRTLQTLEGETLEDVGRRMITSRAAFTGEAVTEKALATEAASLARINSLTTGEKLAEGATVHSYDATRLTALSGDLKFRHVPQLGKFVGLEDAQITAALDIQMKDKSRLLGQVFVDQGMTTAEKVEQAFVRQKSFKDALGIVQENFLKQAK